MRGASPHQNAGVSVDVDWYGTLLPGHLQAFITHSKELESPYLMFSIVLDEAISLRNASLQSDSLNYVVLASSLCVRLMHRLKDMLASLAAHCDGHSLQPSVAAFQPETFLTMTGRFSARTRLLFNLVPCSQQTPFLAKIFDLETIVDNVGCSFCSAAETLTTSIGRAFDDEFLWEAIDAGHFDLNTCLRELLVMLKCFFRVQPVEQVEIFEAIVATRRISGARFRPTTRCIASKSYGRINSN